MTRILSHSRTADAFAADMGWRAVRASILIAALVGATLAWICLARVTFSAFGAIL